MTDSAIEWTDTTWNPVRGCVKISPGCKHCYAEAFAERFRGVPGHPYERGFDPRLVPDKLGAPLSWQTPRNVFVNSMSDLFMLDVPEEYVAAVFGVMAACSQHTFQVLTKRPERMEQWFAWRAKHPTLRSPYAMADHAAYIGGIRKKGGEAINAMHRRTVAWPLPNVHLGVSVENRKHGLPRIDHLRRVPAAVRFLSIEPLLEDLGTIDLAGIHWVIAGSESGHGARPMNEDWVRSIRDQCAAAGVPFFYKQRLDERKRKVSLPMLDGVQHAAMPAVSQ